MDNNWENLVERILGGDTKAFDYVYQCTYRQVYLTCMSFLHNEQNVYDIMQDTYITVLTHIHQLKNPDKLVSWINTIAVNKCRDFLGKKMPVYLEDETGEQVLESSDNFLPESYVLNAEKRKIVMNIMQEELPVVLYQTIIMYYFDGMSVSEIAKCMECPEGTVMYRLSSARGKIKRGVQRYEDTTGTKLYSSSTMTVLTAIFFAETQGLSLPNVLTQIFSAAKALGGTAAVSATAVAATTGGAAASGAGKLGIKALFKTVKAKIIAATTCVAITACAVAGVIILKNKDDDKCYKDVDIVMCDNEYVTITVDKIYDQGVNPTELSDKKPVGYAFVEVGPTESLIELNMEINTDKKLYVAVNVLSVNNRSYGADEFVVVRGPALTIDSGSKGTTETLYRNLHTYNKDYNSDMGEITWLRAEVKIVEVTEDPESGNVIEENLVYYDIDNYYIDGEENAVNYVRTTSFPGEEVIVDDDTLRITYISTGAHRDMAYDDGAYYVANPVFYIENKTDHEIYVTAACGNLSGNSLVLYAYGSGYTDMWNLNYGGDEALSVDEQMKFVSDEIENGDTVDIRFAMRDYTEVTGGYMDATAVYDKYGVFAYELVPEEFYEAEITLHIDDTAK